MSYEREFDFFEYAKQFVSLNCLTFDKKNTFNVVIESNNFDHNVLIHTVDRAFIVSSILLLCKNKNIKIIDIKNQVLCIKRSEKHQITSISKPSEDNAHDNESVIFLHVNSEVKSSELQTLLQKLLSTIVKCTDDYSKMQAFVSNLAQNLKTKQTDLNSEFKSPSEVSSFLSWISKNGFVLLGTRSSSDAKLGLCAIEKLDEKFENKNFGIEITKSSTRSQIHRDMYLDVIRIEDENAEHQLFGLFTTETYNSDITEMPVLKPWIEGLLKKTGYLKTSYNYKKFLSFANNIPRDTIFQVTSDEMYDFGIEFVSNTKFNKNTVIIRRDRHKRFYDVVIFILGDFYDSSSLKLKGFLSKTFETDHISEFASTTTEFDQHVIKFVIYSQKSLSSDQLYSAKEYITNLTTNWDDLFYSHALKAGMIFNLKNPFSSEYKSAFSPSDGFLDYINMLKVFKKSKIGIDILTNSSCCNCNENCSDCDCKNSSEQNQNLVLKIYLSGIDIPVYNLLPILNNFNVNVIEEKSYTLDNIFLTKSSDFSSTELKNNKTYLKYLTVKINHFNEGIIKIENIKDSFEELLAMVIEGETENGILNSLSINPGLKPREILILRAYLRYMSQISFTYSKRTSGESLIKHPALCKLFCELFYAKFDPINHNNSAVESIQKQISSSLSKLNDVTDEKVLKTMNEVINATVRTSFFLDKSCISFKISCKNISSIPKPVPFMEIFVYGSEVDGIHLRSGKVARGGIRWSDRLEDFRTEILGLVKAQNVKNAVIVPSGAKGGFVIKKDVSKMDKQSYLDLGKECYKKFISSCLDLTDNVVDGKVVTPKNVIRYDDQDPYFVVAADKGTATFSDIANEISKSYNFWLGDAFASGGSNGYDHKKMAITAKGAWIAAKRHFMEIGKNIEKEDFTCVGIGDMSGDVFGNGMLRSKSMKLIAAFNHMHIFIDPSPDTKKSFTERERMFNLPRSTWADYDKSTLSKGAMIYERSQTVLKLTQEIQQLFSIKQEEISPNELIKIILTSKYDLLWNGGIGTYVKASHETNQDVGDKSNDAVRVNGCDLQCLAVAEGGNLGFTQLGRVEYATKGGMINTDAMDNSAGVDCSDHEVNIKIALNELVKAGKMTIEERNQLLLDMTPEVDKLVLSDNYHQTLSISVSYRSKSARLESQEAFIKLLENDIHLDRENEFLPSKAEMHRRIAKGSYLTRPELCVLFGYSKIHLYGKIISSKLIQDKFFEREIINYFPYQMSKEGSVTLEAIKSHQLKNEIISTSIINQVINRLGITFITNIATESGLEHHEVVKFYIAIREIFGMEKIWSIIDSMDFTEEWSKRLKLISKTLDFVESSIFWLISNAKHSLSLSELISFYQPIISIVRQNFKTTKQSQIELEMDFLNYMSVSIYSAKYIALKEMDYKIVAESFEKTLTLFGIDIISQTYESFLSSLATNVEKSAVKILFRKLMSSISDISYKLAKEAKQKSVDDQINQFTNSRSAIFSSYQNLVNNLQTKDGSDSKIAILSLIYDKIQLIELS